METRVRPQLATPHRPRVDSRRPHDVATGSPCLPRTPPIQRAHHHARQLGPLPNKQERPVRLQRPPVRGETPPRTSQRPDLSNGKKVRQQSTKAAHQHTISHAQEEGYGVYRTRTTTPHLRRVLRTSLRTETQGSLPILDRE